MENDKIEHIHCRVCGKQLSRFDDQPVPEIEAEPYIEIKRARKEFEVNDNCIEGYDENVKMLREICGECFVKILNESKTLGKLFLDKKQDIFIY